jgi:RAB protein geranylgeranyltransferase component A
MTEQQQEDSCDNYYDYIFLGTGLIESILSCSLAKRGKKILHLDRNDFYGETFLSLNLTNAMKYFHNTSGSSVDSEQSSTFEGITMDDETSNFLLIPSRGGEHNKEKIENAIVGEGEDDKAIKQQLKLFHLYNKYFTKYFPSSKKSSYLHPVYFSYLNNKDNKFPLSSTFSSPDAALSAENCHPSYFPLFSGEKTCLSEEERFLSLLINYDRYFNIDLTPKLIYCSGEFINILVSSGIHHYLEFKAMDSLYYFLSSSASTSGSGTSSFSSLLSSSSVPAASSSTSCNVSPSYSIWKVPSNKNDIFLSKHLSAMEKRLLMKFYQFIFDYSKSHIQGKNLSLLNENELMMGRALYRPQNKSIEINNSSTAISSSSDTASSPSDASTASTVAAGSASTSSTLLLPDIIYNNVNYKNKSFNDLLNAFQLNDKLKTIIIYALCFHYATSTSSSTSTTATPSDPASSASVPTPPPSTCTGIQDQILSKPIHSCLYDLSVYFNSLGIFGETSFLSPFYGISESIQGFCRMSAVWGSTFILRRTIKSIQQVVNADKNETESQKVDDTIVSTIESIVQKGDQTDNSTVQPDEVENSGEAVDEGGVLRKKRVLPSSYLLVKDNEGNEYKCSKLISNAAYFPSVAHCAPYFSYHLILILSGSSVASVPSSLSSFFSAERSIGIIPPHFQFQATISSENTETPTVVSLKNNFAIFIHQSEHSTESSPEGMSVLHLHTLIEDYGSLKEENGTLLKDWQRRAKQSMSFCQELTNNLGIMIKSEKKISFIDEKQPKSSSSTFGSSFSSSTTSTSSITSSDTKDELNILFSRSFLRPIVDKSWEKHVENSNIYLTHSYNYSTLHLENEVVTCKEILKDLLSSEEKEGKEEEDNEKNEIELFETEKKTRQEEVDEDETNEANEYMNIYQKVVSVANQSNIVSTSSSEIVSQNDPDTNLAEKEKEGVMD